MTPAGTQSNGPSKNERREAAREQARIHREQLRKKERRTRLIWQGGGVLSVVLVVALIVWISLGNQKVTGGGPTNMASDGFKVSLVNGEIKPVLNAAQPATAAPIPNEQATPDKVANIVIYVDYLCPICGQFEKTNAPTIDAWLKKGFATLEVHPIAILTNQSLGTKYSLRAANAMACVAALSPDNAYAYNKSLFENQPEEGTDGLKNSKLTELASAAGASGSAVADCIDKGTYQDWVVAATTRATGSQLPQAPDGTKVTGTPTVIVNGQPYKLTQAGLTDPADFTAFVTKVVSAATPTATEAPTATPTATP
ncbi:MAG TPA: thioredoxin domain-containing protein [Candidatus Lumbricidophila sp.]|nr:thioredoxin domain-containing protein [Candidatus Lumbricidophila sp.]